MGLESPAYPRGTAFSEVSNYDLKPGGTASFPQILKSFLKQNKELEALETAFEVLSLITASTALTLLIRARTTRSFKPAILLLYICIGFNVAEVVTRRFLKIKATAESATIETITVALIVTALVYALRTKRKGTEEKLGPAIMCMAWAVTIFALELLLGFILSYYK